MLYFSVYTTIKVVEDLTTIAIWSKSNCITAMNIKHFRQLEWGPVYYFSNYTGCK